MGAGVLLVLRGLRPRTVGLDTSLAALDRPGVSVANLAATERPDLTPPQRLLATGGLNLMTLSGMTGKAKLIDQLRVLDKPIERHAYEKLLAATAGFAFPLMVTVALAAAGTPISPVVGLIAAAALGAGGFVYPDLPLTDRVEERRRAFRHAFSAYLDLVTILLAGGAGIESALEGAAEAGDGWAFAEIRRALRRARHLRHTPWEAFDQLGNELGVSELCELAASVSLAGDHGARIKDSLTAKSDALRSSQAAQLEEAAETRTEKMIVPVVVMILGLVLFIAFGAVDAITDSGPSQFASTTLTSSPGG
jgi:Flp pilus assembly protein TadB